MLEETLATSPVVTASATFTIYPLLALLAVFAAGWWVIERNHFAWEYGRMADVWETHEQKKPFKRWVDGNFPTFAGKWEGIWLGSVLFGSVAAIVGGVLTQNSYAPYLFGTFGFISAFTGWTDFWVRKAPIEMSHLGLYALFPAAVFGLLDPTLIPLRMAPITFFGLPAQVATFTFCAAVLPGLMVLLFVLTRGGIGLADIRGLWMVTFAFAWWLGGEEVILLALISIFVQLLAHIPANTFGWGELRKAPFPGLRKVVNGIYGRLTRSERELWPSRSRAIPWLPAIGLTFTLGALVMLVVAPQGLLGLALPTY